MTTLRHFTDDELLAELVRRKNATRIAKPEHWCHDCTHFKTWDEEDRGRDRRRGGPLEMPDDFNPCTKGHAMQFIVPGDHQDPHGGDWGHYRRVCADRDPA